MDTITKKAIDARTREFREKLAKLTYEKIKQVLVPSPTPLKGYPANEEVTISVDESVLSEALRLKSPSKTTTVDIDYIGSSSDINQSQREYNIKIKKTGRQMADITGKKGDIVKFLQGDAYAMDDEDIKDIFPELLEAIEEESDSKEFQQELDLIANMIKKGEHERLAKMIKRTKALKGGGGWNMAQKPSKKQKDQYNKMVGDHKKKHRALYAR